MKIRLHAILVFFIISLLQSHAQDTELCEVPSEAPALGDALLQTRKQKTCSAGQLQATVADGTQPCAKLKGLNYVSGAQAALNEKGYQETAQLCCHHEMSLFTRRLIAREGFDICDTTDLHGFVHWYDCTNDQRTFAEMKEEIQGVMTSNCPWLGQNSFCPQKGPNCRDFDPCKTDFPANYLPGATAPRTEEGYQAVALTCCHTEMEAFVRRVIDRQRFAICDEGGLQGFLHWFDCTDDGQTYEKLKEGIAIARTGLAPLCPWLGGIGEECPPRGHNCPWVEEENPADGGETHRRRTACR